MRMFDVRILDDNECIEEYIRLPLTKEFVGIITKWMSDKVIDDIKSTTSETEVKQ